MIQDHGLTLPLVQDTNQALAEELGLTHIFPEELSSLYLQFGIDVPQSNGSDEWKLPMPASYLIDKDGIIRETAINPDYTQRPEPSEMLQRLSALA